MKAPPTPPNLLGLDVYTKKREMTTEDAFRQAAQGAMGIEEEEEEPVYIDHPLDAPCMSNRYDNFGDSFPIFRPWDLLNPQIQLKLETECEVQTDWWHTVEASGVSACLFYIIQRLAKCFLVYGAETERYEATRSERQLLRRYLPAEKYLKIAQFVTDTIKGSPINSIKDLIEKNVVLTPGEVLLSCERYVKAQEGLPEDDWWLPEAFIWEVNRYENDEVRNPPKGDPRRETILAYRPYNEGPFKPQTATERAADDQWWQEEAARKAARLPTWPVNKT